MSLPITTLETHTTGTLNVNGIVNGNWEILEGIFDPATLDSDPLYGVAAAAAHAHGALTTITYANPFDVSMLNRLSRCVLTGDPAITVSNKTAGRVVRLILTASGADRTVTWPVGATWAGPAVSVIASGTSVVVTIASTTTADAGLVLSRGGAAYTAGNGLTVTGTVFTIDTAITMDLTTVQTATNKTFTAPVITSGNISAATFKLVASAYVEITASRALTDADNGKILWQASASNWTLTAPDSLAKPFGCTLKQEGTGALVVAVSGTAVLRNIDTHARTGGQWASAAIDYRTGNDVVLSGRTAT